MRRKTVTILLRIRVGGHFVMSITKNHESHYVGVLDNPRTTNSPSQDSFHPDDQIPSKHYIIQCVCKCPHSRFPQGRINGFPNPAVK